MIQKLDIKLDDRIETGALQIGDDWPGLFIRGDDCMVLLYVLKDHTKYSTIMYDILLDELISEIETSVLLRKQ